MTFEGTWLILPERSSPPLATIAGATFYLSDLLSAVLLGYVIWRVIRSLRP